MTAPTHISFSLLSLLGIGLMIGKPATAPAVALASVASLLPDIDTERSAIGHALFPLSAWLERKLGHRGATHSLLAVLILGVAATPLMGVNREWWLALLVGYVSHILIDATNKQGVRLFYPSPVRAVMPKAEKWRIASGSKAELILFVLCSAVGLLLWPMNHIGLFPSLHALLADTHSAIADYRAWENSYRVIAFVKGLLNISQQPIAAEFEVLGVQTANSLVVYDETKDVLYTVGTDPNANLYPQRIRCRKGEPIQVITQKVHLENELFGNLMSHLPQEGKTWISGTLKTQEKVIVPVDPDTYQTIKPGLNELSLRYAQARDLAPVEVSTIFGISGDFYLRTILPASTPKVPSTPPSPSHPKEGEGTFSQRQTQTAAKSTIHTTEMYLHNVKSPKEIRVTEGQEIKVGDLIAELSHPQDAQHRAEEQHLMKQIATYEARADPVSTLFLTNARSRLKAIKAEQEQNRIYSAVNGRVLWIRTHAIVNNNRTIAIKLLVHEP